MSDTIVQIHAHPSDDAMNLVTEGLAAHDHPELVVTGVTEAWRPHAETLLTMAAEFCALNPCAGGQTMFLPTIAGQLVVRFEVWPAQPACLMLVDLSDLDEGCPFIALATIWGWKAAMIAEDDTATSLAMLREAIELQPVLGDREPDIVWLYNWDGAMNLLLLGALTGELEPVREAFRRSPETELRTLGDPIDDLLHLDADTLAHAAAILAASQFTNLQPIAGAESAVFTGPLAVREGPLLVLDRSVVTLEAYMELTSAAVMNVLYDSSTHELAASVVLSRSATSLWLELPEVRRLHAERPHATHTHTSWLPGMRLVSYVLADFARLLAGGASIDDLPAWYSLVDDAEAKTRVEAAAQQFASLA